MSRRQAVKTHVDYYQDNLARQEDMISLLQGIL
jgi:hypothetical protein